MTTERIPCKNESCSRTILPDTAKRFNGVCAPCNRNNEYNELQKRRNDLVKQYSDNPPKNKAEIEQILSQYDPIEGMWLGVILNELLPPLLDYTATTKKGFQKNIKKIVAKHNGDLGDISSDFLGISEPLIFKYEDNLYKGLKLIPRPFRELNAAYQFWGMMISDGIDSYMQSSCKAFDQEAIQGFELLSLLDTAKVVTESRLLWGHDGTSEVAEELERSLTDRVYEELGDYEEHLGNYLIKTTKMA